LRIREGKNNNRGRKKRRRGKKKREMGRAKYLRNRNKSRKRPIRRGGNHENQGGGGVYKPITGLGKREKLAGGGTGRRKYQFTLRGKQKRKILKKKAECMSLKKKGEEGMLGNGEGSTNETGGNQGTGCQKNFLGNPSRVKKTLPLNKGTVE